MSISYLTTASSLSYSIRDGYIDTVNDYFLFVTSTNLFKRYNLATGTQVGSDVTVTSSPQAVCLINSASAFVATTNATTHNFIEISSGYVQNVTFTSSSACRTTNETSGTNAYQKMDVDPINQVAIYLRSAAATAICVVSSSQTGTNITVPLGPSSTNTFECIKYTRDGLFVIGTQHGRIVEINRAGTVQRVINVQESATLLIGDDNTTTPSISFPRVNAFAYGDDVLAVATTIGLFLYQYSTFKLIKYINTFENSTYMCLSEMVSGEVGFCSTTAFESQQLTVAELDLSVRPGHYEDQLFLSQTSQIMSQIRVSPTGRGVAIYGTSVPSFNMAFFTVTPRGSTTRTITVTRDGNNIPFRLITIDDTGGVGSRRIIWDTFAQSPYTYRVPLGKNLMELIKYEEGTSAQWGYGRVTT